MQRFKRVRPWQPLLVVALPVVLGVLVVVALSMSLGPMRPMELEKPPLDEKRRSTTILTNRPGRVPSKGPAVTVVAPWLPKPGTSAVIPQAINGGGCLKIQFRFDYDVENFFGDHKNPKEDNIRRRTLRAAGRLFERMIATPMGAIEPSFLNSFTATFRDYDPHDGKSVRDPDQGEYDIEEQENLKVPENTLVIFVEGSSHMDKETIGETTSGLRTRGLTSWFQRVITRGTGKRMPWGACIAFNTKVSYHFDPNWSLVPNFPGKIDFKAVALHEIMHALMFGAIQAQSPWTELIGRDGKVFLGQNVRRDLGYHPPLTEDQAHFRADVMSTVYGTRLPQVSIMAAEGAENAPRLITDVDVAALQDLGWTIASPDALPYYYDGTIRGIRTRPGVAIKPLQSAGQPVSSMALSNPSH